MTAWYQQVEQFAIITLANPPVNGLSAASRAALAQALHQAEHATSVDYVLIQGAGRGFCGGADIREFNTAAATASPTLAELILRLETARKVHIAVMHGMALGGGLELALACHYRLAQQSTLLGLPEVKLGLIPGAGGTQRLPRLIDYDLARYLILSGELKTATELAHSGLLDAVFEDNDQTGFAQRWVVQHQPQIEGRVGRLSAVCHRPESGLKPSEQRALSALLWHPALATKSAALAMAYGDMHGYQAGLSKERDLFLSLLQSDQSQRMRRLFFAERDVIKLKHDLSEVKRAFSAAASAWLSLGLASECSLTALQFVLASQGYALSAFFNANDVVDLSSAAKLPENDLQLARELVNQLDAQLIAQAQHLQKANTGLDAQHIDSLALTSCGWPRHRGGPLFYAGSYADRGAQGLQAAANPLHPRQD